MSTNCAECWTRFRQQAPFRNEASAAANRAVQVQTKVKTGVVSGLNPCKFLGVLGVEETAES